MKLVRAEFVLGAMLLFSGGAYAGAGGRQLTIDDIFVTPKLRTHSLESVRWLGRGERFSFLKFDTTKKQQELYVYDPADGKRELVMDASWLIPGGSAAKGETHPFRYSTYQWSPDGREILLTGTMPARRTMTGGNFAVFTVASHAFRLLTDTSAQQTIEKLSPDGSKVGFVRDNNLWVVDVATGKQTQLTFDGSENIINGKFDWVYQEEFEIIDGWQWSPDSRRIAFWRLDQSRVPTFPLVRYSITDPHANIEWEHYPKAGDPNSAVKIGVVNLQDRSTQWLDLGSNPDIYIPRIQWTNDPVLLSVQRLNRRQDTLDLMLANVEDGTIRTVLRETDTAWIDITNDLRFLKRSREFLWTSMRDGYRHLYLYTLDGKLVRELTREAWDVASVAGVDEEDGRVLFTAAAPDPMERQLFTVNLDGTGLRRISDGPGEHEVNVAPDGKAYLDTYSTVNMPPDEMLRWVDGRKPVEFIHNTLGSLREYSLSKVEFFTFKTSDGVSLNGWMLRPPGFDPSRRYPVLMVVYGGPGAQTVLDRWGGSGYLWHQLLAEKGYIVASVDNRGTGARGKTFMQQTHRRLGLQETHDQIEAAKYLGSLPYVDPSRIGIWGWSFGGYMTCMAMTLGADVFKTGVAVAPVTSWRYYDTIYTERYMDTPEHNPDGYRETSPITYADRLKGHFLIIHGTTDDNVHWENTITFVNELIRNNRQFRTMFYPGRNHGIYTDNATRHLYTMMTDFILENL